ncbi:uncharacterized protein K02A2.6-like [Lampris incognitus]|uniref:uncharacterized protein K02A2.6-like n=1 Tax=Lampris incognitus TaxID=2546036 RepID=UPI0024B6037C|nr:uncharacterized protein K02A2.6-like [Lampris incognitus]
MGVRQVCLQSVESILTEYAEVFQDLGASRTPPIGIDIDTTASPKFFKARSVPFALRSKLDEELDKLVAQDIFEPMRHSRRATPIVPVLKKDGSLRICGDYRCTVNTVVKPDVYPIPTVAELFSRLAGGVLFSKLDLKQAYQQLVLDDEAAELLTINIHRRLFRARRLQFGVSTAASIFQRFMDTLLAGIPGMQPYLDDVLIAGKTVDQHNDRLRAVLERFAEAGLQLQKEKSVFAADQVEILGFRLQADGVLTHYDETKPLAIVCDALPYGLGALLFHMESNGWEAPIVFASRTLSSTERNYAQIDKEALAVIFAVKKIHQYLVGRHFVVFTDHKPLLGLLHQSKPMPPVLSPCMLRWSVLLGAYDYELCYRPGKQLANADAHGWPVDTPYSRFKPFFTQCHELSAHKDCLLWGSRVVIPNLAREEVLAMLHDAHPGTVHMKGLGRSYAWWPGMDLAIEQTVKSCETCQRTHHAPPTAQLHPWEWTTKKWSRLHIDFAGPFQGKTFLIIVDSHSKWLEVAMVSSMSSSAVISTLRLLFATHGLPDVIVSDNGAAFTSEEFKEFARRNGIRAVSTAPYHPRSNGQAERMVQSTKEALPRITIGDWQTRLARFLLSQHVTPNSATGKSPAERLMNRHLTTAFDRLHPDYENEIFDLNFLLGIFCEMFAYVDVLTGILQSKALDMQFCPARLEEFCENIEKQRDRFDAIYGGTECDVGEPGGRRGQGHGDIRLKYRKLHSDILDNIQTQITNRFKDHEKLALLCLLDPQQFPIFKVTFPNALFSRLTESHGTLFVPRLKTELTVMYSLADFQGKSPADLLMFLQQKKKLHDAMH